MPKNKDFLKILKERFEKNMDRHKNILWEEVEDRLDAKKLAAIDEMERTGGEPDIVGDEYVFYDCSKETPKGRVNACYDSRAQKSRKDVHPPGGNAVDMAKKMGIDILSEEDYIFLQTHGEFDLKTSSWLLTPKEVRNLGGAIFGDRRYGRVFVYHNGAQSFYAARGWRGKLKI